MKCFGIDYNGDIPNDLFVKNFDELPYGGEDEILLVSKKTFHYKEDGLEFDYKICVSMTNMYNITGDEELKGKIQLDLILMPTINSLVKDMREVLAQSSGVDETELNLFDAYAYGNYAPLASDVIEADNFSATTVSKRCNEVAAVYEVINNLIGFYLDKPINLIGETGWNLIEHMVNDKPRFWSKK